MDKKNMSTPLLRFLYEWGLVLSGLFRPLVLLPLILTIGALYFANSPDIDKRLSFILQIFAVITTAIASAFFYDLVREILSNDILIKKGQSAVRNLSLARIKTNNISDRVKENASTEEIRNLLSLLEKDIANATQEWNDILPGIGKIEEVYTMLSEKEKELERIKKEKEGLDKRLIEERELSTVEKDSLKKNLEEKKKRIYELLGDIDKLRVTTTSVPFSGDAISTYPYLNILGTDNFMNICKKCGKIYATSTDEINVSSLLNPNANVCKKCRSLP